MALVAVRLLALAIPPPPELSAIVELMTVNVPPLKMAPPWSAPAAPFLPPPPLP